MPRYKKNQQHKQFVLRVNEQGRVVIPAPMRKALGLKPGAEVVGHLENGKVILSPRSPLQTLRSKLKRPKVAGLVDEFLAEREQEARAELSEE